LVKFGAEDQNFAKQEIMSETMNTSRLARNARFAHLGASKGCQSVVHIGAYGQNQALWAHVWAENVRWFSPGTDAPVESGGIASERHNTVRSDINH
jgi:hypothetical protein